MYSWNDFINDFPYTNFSDINVSWFLNKFKQIFDEWEGLYNQMLSWKTATDEYNATWRTEQEQAFTTWENNFQTAIDAWKAQTETDIGTWETDTIASIEAWKAVFINQYNALKLEVEQIAEDAEAAKNSAQTSATSAANSASSASATALSLQASLNQINTNTNDISELKTQLNVIDDDVMSLRFIDGVYINTTTDTYQSASSAKWILYPVSPGDVVYIKAPVGYSVNYTVFNAYIPAVVGETPPYATGYSGGLTTLSALQDVTITIPADGKYLVFAPNNSTVSARILTINGVSVDDLYTSENLRERVATIKTSIENELGTYDPYTPAEIINGVLKSDGTIATFSIPINKYENLPTGTLYIKGTGTLTPNNSFCYAWRVKNGVMVDYVIAQTNPQVFDYTPIEIDNDTVDSIWLYGRLDLCYKTANDKYARQKINTFENYLCGMQWKGKTWYAYGTSITSVHQNTGKYPTYLAQMSGMTLVEKGIGGGGIGNLGAYSQGQVYNAICNITDGKLNADLISLETGANDVNADVPLGTIYDEGQTTLAGCLNDCLRYLQANTNAQIVVTCSPANTTKPESANKYYEWAAMVEQICHLNRVHFLNADNNMGWAKLADSTKGQLYVVDNIHQTDLGGYIMAQNLWYQLRNIPLFYTEIPS